MLGRSITRNSLILGAFAAATAGLIALTFQNTKNKISEQERLAAQKALFEIVPQSRHDNDLLQDLIQLPSEEAAALGMSEGSKVHIAKSDGSIIAYILPVVAPDGYSGDIKMIVGVNVDGTVAGVRVLSHKETPGLGDKVDLNKSPWILGFEGKSLNNPRPENWRVKKDGGHFDQFTGATITPRAVVGQVKQVLEYLEAHKFKL